MKNLTSFKNFSVNESSAAGNRDHTYQIPFSYTSNDPKIGYSSKSFVDDLKSIFIEKPHIKSSILEFLTKSSGISRIDDLATKPFSLIKDLIPEIERIIGSGEYEPELTMPGGALLFIRNKIMCNGKGVDLYINRKGTKIEVVSEDENGKEKVSVYDSNSFPRDRYELTQEEKEELDSILKAKGN
jgi:hypothetical protein